MPGGGWIFLGACRGAPSLGFEDLVRLWTLTDADRQLVASRYVMTRLGFALMLRFFQVEGRFPRDDGEIPVAAVGFVTSQLSVEPSELLRYDWSGRSVEEHRREIRQALGFRVFTRGDEDKMVAWLSERVCPYETDPDRLRRAVLQRCRDEGLEPPGRGGPGRGRGQRRRRPAVLRHRRGPAARGHGRCVGQPRRAAV
jgi:hypothetical protein